MAYRKSNDSWKQLLIRLDEIGEKAWFIHVYVVYIKRLHRGCQDEWYRTDPIAAGLTPYELFDSIDFFPWITCDADWAKRERVYYKLLNKC